jgi:colanic acid/amylovoran biosynthesis glycosyltransferase
VQSSTAANTPGQSPVVAHWVDEYLSLTETFIYLYLKNLRQFRPLVIAGRVIGNRELFPVADLYALSGRLKSWKLRGRRVTDFIPVDLPEERILSRFGARLIHAHFGYTGHRALRAKSRLRLPLVTTFYGCDMSSMARQKKWQERYRRLFDRGDLFLVEGDHMRARLIELGAPPQKVEIQRIAIDLRDFEFALRTPPRQGPVRLIACGRFTEKKGLRYAIEALRLLRDENLEAELRVIGDGELRPELEQLVESLALGDRVKLLGYLPYSTYAEEMAQAHILLCPSVTAGNGDSEGGAPTVLLEAQASGLPIVATTHADIPNVVRDGETALLAPERDAQALAEHLGRLITSPALWAEMGTAGRAWIEETHDIQREVGRLEERYQRLIDRAR